MNTTAQSLIHDEPAPSRMQWIWTPFLLLCLIAAAAALRRLVTLLAPSTSGPSLTGSLDADFAARKTLTLLHIVPALAFILLLPGWFARSVRRHSRAIAILTRILLVLGAVIGITAIPMSFHPVGGINESSASLLYDALFLFSLARSAWFFHQSRLQLQRTWMMRAIAVLLGIATTRPIVGVFFATRTITHLQPQQFFGTAFWLGFTVTYIAGEAYLRSRGTVPVTS
ncbi:MAG TPA: hypothetical protein VK716_15925 [Terracidiphilus sp.]|jgi:hypothetical protein|nr:hypothetical protein [Terracidiphilus sp.]